MRWKTKARLQNAVSFLPSQTSYATYYWLQRHFGGLRKMNPVTRLAAGIDTWRQLEKLGCRPAGRNFLEVGTGRVPMTPLAYWLMGAKGITTIDLNPYLKMELTRECLQYIAHNQDQIQALFGALLDQKRLNDLLQWYGCEAFTIAGLLELCQINYIAPGDATSTTLHPGSIDFHTSFNVFEHIPPNVLLAILKEGNRIISADGVFVHRVDYSDHFSHSDTNISPINFLQYSDDEWEGYAGNRYMYMNRMRHDDFMALFQAAGQCVLATEPVLHSPSLDLLRRGNLRIDRRFEAKSSEVLATTESWIVARRAD